MKKRLVYICDWLPPDFGAVGQYAVLFARDWARNGWAVTLVGLTTGNSGRDPARSVGEGTLEVVRIHRRTYSKQNFASRLLWTFVSNMLLLQAGFTAIRRADTVLFTGSPPLMLHFIAPLNLILRKQLIYRITDFHPECHIAERGKNSFALHLLLRLTHFWRRRISVFEVLGVDQGRRLAEVGISQDRIRLKRDPSPITFPRGCSPLPLPDELCGGSGVILYSGNWGIAHDDDTFIEAYQRYFSHSKLGLRFWLNATGAKADRVEKAFRSQGLPIYRSNLVPLETLPKLLLAADVHLITLRDPFVGYVLPSKVHACIESGKRILFIGKEDSDVHLLASRALPVDRYYRVAVNDVERLVQVLNSLEQTILAERRPYSESEVTNVTTSPTPARRPHDRRGTVRFESNEKCAG